MGAAPPPLMLPVVGSKSIPGRLRSRQLRFPWKICHIWLGNQRGAGEFSFPLQSTIRVISGDTNDLCFFRLFDSCHVWGTGLDGLLVYSSALVALFAASSGDDGPLESPKVIPVATTLEDAGANNKKIQDGMQTNNSIEDERSNSISSSINRVSLDGSNGKESVISGESAQSNLKSQPKPEKKPATRAKVPFEKGFSQMDWLKLTRTHPDLAVLPLPVNELWLGGWPRSSSRGGDGDSGALDGVTLAMELRLRGRWGWRRSRWSSSGQAGDGDGCTLDGVHGNTLDGVALAKEL
ncbi:hypothetical protein ABZP36_000055 [Zizania latifolia]